MTPDIDSEMQAVVLDSTLDQNRRMMRKCPHGCTPTLEYSPGVTHGGCEHRAIAFPDWAPVELRKQWNDSFPTKK